MQQDTAPEIVLFTGSRNWTDREPVRRDLASLPPGSIVIQGGARGLDRIAREEGRALGIHVATVEALWDSHGRSAGHRRNEAMLRLRPDRAFAYPLGESRGTHHMIRACEAAGVAVCVRWAEAARDLPPSAEQTFV